MLKSKPKPEHLHYPLREHHFDQIDDLANKASGKSNDQVLIWINSHGSPGSFCISETESLRYDDPEFQAHLARLKKSGAKLGFLTEACYSGSSITALSKFGCAISSQGPNKTAAGSPLSELFSGDPTAPEDEKTHTKPDYSLKAPLSMSDFYMTALGYTGYRPNLSGAGHTDHNIPQISGFSSGLRLSENYLKHDRFLDLNSGRDLNDHNLYFYPTENSKECVLNSTESAITLKQISALKGVDQAVIQKYFGSCTLPLIEVAMRTQIASQRMEVLNAEFEKTSAREFQVTNELQNELRIDKISMDGSFLTPLMNEISRKKTNIWYGDVEKLLNAAAKEAGLDSATVSWDMGKPTKVNFAIPLQSTAEMGRQGSAQWKAISEKLVSSIYKGLPSLKLPKSVLPDPKLMPKMQEELANDGLTLEKRQAKAIELTVEQMGLRSKLRELKGRIDSTYHDNIQGSLTFNQYLAYQYLHESLSPPNDEDKKQREACDQFKLKH